MKIPTELKFLNVQIHLDRLKPPIATQDSNRLAHIAGSAEKCVRSSGTLVSCRRTTRTALDLTFSTDNPVDLWEWLEAFLKHMELGKATIVVCQGDHGWDDYLLLHHFDRTLKLDKL